MHSVHPVADPLLWLRFAAAAVICLWLPGHLLLGRFLASADRTSRALLSFSAGLLWMVALGLCLSWIRIPLRPLIVVPLVWVLGGLVGLWPNWRVALASLDQRIAPLSAHRQRLLISITLLFWMILVFAFSGFVAPPHVHDASNHAFMVQRVAEVHSADPAAVFADLHGSPEVLYLVGWHLAAALLASVGGLAPYVAAWQLVLLCLALVPAALTVLWRQLGAASSCTLWGAAILATSPFMPSGLMGWGGFGQIIGTLLVPLASLLVAGGLNSKNAVSAALAGAALGAILHIHASEVLVSLLLGIWLARRGGQHGRDQSSRRRVSRALIGLVAFGLVAGPPVWRLALDYNQSIGATAEAALLAWSDAVRRFFRAVGKPELRVPLTILGLGLGLWSRRYRGMALASLALGLFYVLLAAVADPVSKLLARPFYEQSPRILYLQIYVLPPLWGLIFLKIHAWSTGRRRLPLVIGAVLLAALWLGSGLRKELKTLKSYEQYVPFSEQAYEHAVRMAASVEEGALVANINDDGSTWAGQVSGVRFLSPASWFLFDGAGDALPHRVLGLRHDPWSESARALRELGVAYLYVSDLSLASSRRPGWTRAHFDRDERFRAAVESDVATLYRIEWSATSRNE